MQEEFNHCPFDSLCSTTISYGGKAHPVARIEMKPKEGLSYCVFFSKKYEKCMLRMALAKYLDEPSQRNL